MKLEVGKYYKDASGNKVGPMIHSSYYGTLRAGNRVYFMFSGECASAEVKDCLVEEFANEV